MVDDELGDHPQLSSSGLLHETAEILHRAEIWIDVEVVRNVVILVVALVKYADRGQSTQQPIKRRRMRPTRVRHGKQRLRSILRWICDTKGSGDIQRLRHLVPVNQSH